MRMPVNSRTSHRYSWSMWQIASLASNRAISANRNASSMRGPQNASNSRLKTRSAFPTAWSRFQPQTDIEQVHPKRTPVVAEVEIHHMTVALGRHQAQCGGGQIAVRVHEDQTAFSFAAGSAAWSGCAGQHQVMHELEHQGRFPTTGFGNRQQMAPQQAGRQHDLDVVPLVVRYTDPASLPAGVESHGGRQRKASACGGAFDEGNVVGSMRQVPQTTQLPHIQQGQFPQRDKTS
jgi:hypothetical protein